MWSKNQLTTVFILILTTITTGCLPDPPTGPTLWEKLTETPEYSTFVTAMEITNFDKELIDGFAYTLFVPTNEAFDAWFTANNYSDINDIPWQELRYLMRYHMVLGEVDITISPAGYLNTMSPANPDSIGLVIFAESTGSTIELNDTVSVTQINIDARNGFINELEAVLDIPTVLQLVRANKTFSNFEEAIVKGGLVSRLQNLSTESTILLPTNSAFDEFLSDQNINDLDDLSSNEIKQLVKTHILPQNLVFQEVIDASNSGYLNMEGNEVRITSFQEGQMIVENTIGVPRYDMQGRNGVIHVISGVINPF